MYGFIDVTVVFGDLGERVFGLGVGRSEGCWVNSVGLPLDFRITFRYNCIMARKNSAVCRVIVGLRFTQSCISGLVSSNLHLHIGSR